MVLPGPALPDWGARAVQVEKGCVVCPAHGTAFDLKTGAVEGEW
jgi:nitrite reductase/ring-hydroxylating ferredoxin subunit